MRTIQVGLDWLSERPGGLPRYYRDLVRWLPGKGVDVRGLVAGSTLPATETGGTVRSFCRADAPLARRLLAARGEMRRLLAAFEPDVVASHFALYTLPCLDLLSYPLVVHFHGPWALEGNVEGATGPATLVKRKLEGVVYRRARRHIVLSEAFGRMLHQGYGIPWDRIRVVPGGVDTARFDRPLSREQARVALGWPTGRVIVLAVRRLVRRMGLENLIVALDEVRWHVTDVLLVIGGHGPLAAALKRLVEERGLGEHVRLLGRVSDKDLPLAYRAADLSIVPSLSLEGFGLITLESMAAGTPVLVTPVGGLPEAVRGLSEELILAGTTPRDLAEGLRQALSGGRRLPDEASCRAYARHCFDWTAITPRIRAVYEEAQR